MDYNEDIGQTDKETIQMSDIKVSHSCSITLEQKMLLQKYPDFSISTWLQKSLTEEEIAKAIAKELEENATQQ